LARRLGATDEMLDGIAGADYGKFEPGWHVALQWADAMTPTASIPDNALFTDLKRHWNDAQVVEITAVIGLFNYFNRFATALDIPPTR
jgi:alkylhydroperoxidase family enzyme